MLVDSMMERMILANVAESEAAATELRSVMRHWATGICVVTTATAGRRAGLVMNSFASVSLNPALVSWCVDKASTSFDIWMETDNFSIHVLDQDGAHYVPRFAQRGVDKFEGLKTQVGSTGAPTLPDAAVRLDCRLWARYEGGDHIILVGRVDQITQPDSFAPLLSQHLRKPNSE
jgi:3-hydroxy-9,10-secoandrosta-1,3,5(10)-triene-9,17-dione monooxygenase reductase component